MAKKVALRAISQFNAFKANRSVEKEFINQGVPCLYTHGESCYLALRTNGASERCTEFTFKTIVLRVKAIKVTRTVAGRNSVGNGEN
jgi:hypothetical protein